MTVTKNKKTCRNFQKTFSFLFSNACHGNRKISSIYTGVAVEDIFKVHRKEDL